MYSLVRGRLPEEESRLGWIFLHSVLAVGVQFLTATSSFAHLVENQAKRGL